MKIVINRCYGGFGLSEKAIDRYFEIKGIPIFKEKGNFGRINYYFCDPAEFHKLHVEATKNKEYEKTNHLYFYDGNLERNDPVLIQVVEELGEESFDSLSELSIVDIPDNIEWEIEDYDGMESVVEKHNKWF